MKNKKNVPDIRFKGFAEEWTQRKANTICSISTGKSNTQDKEDNGIYPFYVRSTIVERSNKYLFDEEAVLTAGDGVGTGKVFHYVNGRYNLHQRVYRMFNFNDVDGKYFYFYFMTNFYSRVMSMTAKSSVDSVRLDMIAEMKINLPSSIAEQMSIVNWLSEVDRLINTSQTKLDKLKNIKKACLEKMFPRNGSTTPELRFKGFADEWKEKELKDIVDVRSGRDYKHLSVGNIPVYGTGGYMLSVNSALSYHENAVGIGRKGTIDKPYILYAPFWTVDTLFYSVPRKNNDLNFVYDLFQQVDWRKKDESTGVPSLSKVAINSIVVNTTAHREQQAIGAFLKNIDDIIAKTEQQINKLKNIKKACLDKMFVNTEDKI